MIFLTYFRGVGRPLLDIDVTYIEYLRGLRFTFTDIAKMMGISRATIYLRSDDAGIDHACTYSNITDAALDQVVQTINQGHPNDGECPNGRSSSKSWNYSTASTSSWFYSQN